MRSKYTKTPHGSRQKFLEVLLDLIRQVSGGEKYDSLGLGIPGLVNFKTGLILDCHHLPFLNSFNLSKFVTKKLVKRVAVENDTKCFLGAELKFGAGKGMNNVVAITLGTGLGGAVLAEGRVVHGANYSAQLTGMILFQEKNRVYNFQDLVSSHGFARLGISDPLECQILAEKGNQKAIKVYNEIGKYLGIALCSIVKVFDPELIVLGGGISRAGDLLLGPAKAQMKNMGLKYWPEIKVSKLKSPGALGAASLVLK